MISVLQFKSTETQVVKKRVLPHLYLQEVQQPAKCEEVFSIGSKNSECNYL